MTDIYLIILERLSGEHSYCTGYSLDKVIAELAGALCEKWRGGNKYIARIEKRNIDDYKDYLFILEEDKHHEGEFRVLTYTEDDVQEFTLSSLDRYHCNKHTSWEFSMEDLEEMNEMYSSYSNEQQETIRGLYETSLRNK